MISSADNSSVKNILQLMKKSRVRDEQHVFVCEGLKMFEEALESKDIRIRKVFISEHLFESGYAPVKKVDFDVVKDSLFRQISETVTPQGIIAVIEQPEFDEASIFGHETVKLLILEGIQDPGNLGTILRTAEAAGFTAVAGSEGTVDIYNPKVIRSTMGAIFRVPYIRLSSSLPEWMKSILKQHGIVTYAACLDGSEAYDSISYSNRCAILIGNEGNGLTEETKDAADFRIHIPMAGKTESLNAAISAAILMYNTSKSLRK